MGDIEAGDGTTSVCVMAGSLLDAADKLLKKGIHPTSISDSFQKAAAKSVEILTAMSTPVDLSDKESLLKASNTSLNSKVVSQNSAELSPIAVDAVLKIIDPAKENNVNLKDIKIIKKIGGTVDDTELVDGMVFEQKAANVNGPKKIEKAKIGFIQFCVSPPKTDMDNQVVVRLRRHGQSAEGGESLPPQHREADQEGGVQRSPHSEVYLERRPVRPRHPLLRQDEDHGGEGHREGGRGVPLQDPGLPPHRLPGPLHRREPRVGRDGGGGPDRVQQVCKDHRHGHARQDLLHHHPGIQQAHVGGS